jgi:RNA polymerase-binding transcription factor DksA
MIPVRKEHDVLTSDQVKQLRAALGERERVLRSEVRKAIHEKLGHDIPELDSLSDDTAKPVADLLDDIDTGMMMRDVDELMAIEAAKAAFKTGAYGNCATCHGPIDFKRLLALPSATRCLPCQERHERTTWKQREMKL